MARMARPSASSAPAAAAPGAARLELLGVPVLFSVTDERVVLERKAAALLALLAMDGARSRAELAALLWPQVATAQARNSLRQRLFRLQRAAGMELVAGSEELRLADGIVHDLGDGQATLADRPGGRIGTLLEGLAYDDTVELALWVDGARQRVRRQLVDQLAALSSRHESEQRIVQALAYAQRLLAEEPLLEHAHRRVMRLHYLRGDRSAALAAFEQCKQRLRAELAASPDRETLELAALIGAGAASVTASSHELAAAPARPPAPPLSVLRPPRLSGREAPQARIAQAIDARHTLVLHGEPGIGKTRLLEDAADAGHGVLLSGARAGDRRVPYALLARLAGVLHERHGTTLPEWARAELARLLPALGSAPTARLDPLRLQQAWGAALAGWAAAGLRGVLVDDLHHADEASLECLLAQVQAAPVAWVLSVRTHEIPPLLAQWQQAREHGSPADLALQQLEEGAVGSLLESLALPHFDAGAWRRTLTRHSGGNPLFVLETVRALLALGEAAPAPDATRLPVPAALDGLIERRLAQLSERALRLARVAALAGADFDADVAAHVLEAHPLDMVEPWRELEQAQLLRDGRLAHDLIAEATAHALPAGIAQALHARLATALEALGRTPARIAPHWAAAQSWARAGDAYADAAREARRASRRSDEMALWEQAAEGFDRAGQLGKAFDARADSIECVIIVRGVGAAATLVDRLDADQRTEPQRMRSLTARATVCLMGGDAAAGETAARAALALASRLDAQWPRFEAGRLLAIALSQSSRAAEALQVMESFRELVLGQGNAEQRHHFWSDYAYALKAAQRGVETAAALREAMVSAQEAGDFAELATLTSNLALVEGNLGRVQHALDHARRARALGDPLGDAVGPASGAIEMYIASHEAALGRYGESLASFARAQACFGSDSRTVWTGLAANHKAHLLIHLGQYARARQTLQHDGPMMPGIEARRMLLQVRIDRALQHRGNHSLPAALAALAERDDPIVRMLVELEASLELPPAEGAAACTAVHARAVACDLLAVAMRARALRLEHSLLGGSVEPAEVDAVLHALGETHPADTYLPAAWWTVVRAYDLVGRDADARRTLHEAWRWIVEGALPRVPESYRDGFLNRNPTNRALLAAAGRVLSLPAPTLAITAR